MLDISVVFRKVVRCFRLSSLMGCAGFESEEGAVELVTCEDDISRLADNEVRGEIPKLHNSKIVFKGSGNILHCERSARLSDSEIVFNGSNSVAAIGGLLHQWRVACNSFGAPQYTNWRRLFDFV